MMSRNPQSRKVVVAVKEPSTPSNSSASKRKRLRKNRNRQGKKFAQRAITSRVTAHPCTVAFARTLSDPWNTYGLSTVCLPDDQDLPSFKFSIRSRLTAFIGSAGFGFVVAAPGAALMNDVLCLAVSAVAFAGNTVPSAGVSTNCLSTASNSPFSFGNAPNYRLVCAGLRARYAGTELNRGGNITPWRSSVAGTDDLTGKGLNDVLKLNRTEPLPTDRKWHGCVWTPNGGTERAYSRPYASGYDVFSSGTKYLGIVMTGTPGNTYEVDFVTHFECVASPNGGAVPSLTASDSDIEGYSFVRDVYSKISDSTMGPALWNMILSQAKNVVKDQVPFSGPLLEYL